MVNVRSIAVLAFASALAACQADGASSPNSTNSGLSKFDQAYSEYLKCALDAFGASQQDRAAQGQSENKFASIKHSTEYCEDLGFRAAAILMKSEAKDIPYKYRIREDNIRNSLLPLLEAHVEQILSSLG